MERHFSGKSEERLLEIKRLNPPTPTGMFQEWKEERLKSKFHSGFVVGVILVEENPQMARVFYDGGRRRVIENKSKIILEGVDVPVTELLSCNIKMGDLVRADWHFDRLTKVASYEDLTKQDIYIPTTNFDWQEVLGALY